MEKETDTDKILRAIANVHEEIADIKSVMATKDDLQQFATKKEVTELISGEFARLRTEDIDPMKRDIAGLKRDVEQIRTAFAPRIEFDDRLRACEQKLGISSPR